MVGCAVWWWGGLPVATAASEQWTVPSLPPVLPNPGFECNEGYTPGKNPEGSDILVPNGWSVVFLAGAPKVSSTRLFYTGKCDPNSSTFIEKLNGIDSFLVRSKDIETPPQPGKPFDVAIYYQLPATYGGAYSFSAWMTSKCGNQKPVDCPSGYYISKAVGIDPYGGTDPNSPHIEWAENRENQHWQNISTSTTALTTTITIFARMTSPFQFHGNLGFMDEFSLVRAPLSLLEPLPSRVVGTGKVTLNWAGQQSADVAGLASGKYVLHFDVQARALPDGNWHDIVTGATDKLSTEFVAPCLNKSYAFRVRARTELPDGVSGPHQHYPGVWTKPQSVFFSAPIATPATNTVEVTPTLFLPIAGSVIGPDGC